MSRPDVFHFSVQHCGANQKTTSAKHTAAVVIGAQQRGQLTLVSGQAGQSPGWLKRPLPKEYLTLSTRICIHIYIRAKYCGVLRHNPQPLIPGPSRRQRTDGDSTIQRPFISGQASFIYSQLPSINMPHARTRLSSRDHHATMF